MFQDGMIFAWIFEVQVVPNGLRGLGGKDWRAEIRMLSVNSTFTSGLCITESEQLLRVFGLRRTQRALRVY
jgi:hypothetical protein